MWLAGCTLPRKNISPGPCETHSTLSAGSPTPTHRKKRGILARSRNIEYNNLYPRCSMSLIPLAALQRSLAVSQFTDTFNYVTDIIRYDSFIQLNLNFCSDFLIIVILIQYSLHPRSSDEYPGSYGVTLQYRSIYQPRLFVTVGVTAGKRHGVTERTHCSLTERTHCSRSYLHAPVFLQPFSCIQTLEFTRVRLESFCFFSLPTMSSTLRPLQVWARNGNGLLFVRRCLRRSSSLLHLSTDKTRGLGFEPGTAARLTCLIEKQKAENPPLLKTPCDPAPYIHIVCRDNTKGKCSRTAAAVSKALRAFPNILRAYQWLRVRNLRSEKSGGTNIKTNRLSVLVDEVAFMGIGSEDAAEVRPAATAAPAVVATAPAVAAGTGPAPVAAAAVATGQPFVPPVDTIPGPGDRSFPFQRRQEISERELATFVERALEADPTGLTGERLVREYLAADNFPSDVINDFSAALEAQRAYVLRHTNQERNPEWHMRFFLRSLLA
eukprot:g6598.t1